MFAIKMVIKTIASLAPIKIIINLKGMETKTAFQTIRENLRFWRQHKIEAKVAHC